MKEGLNINFVRKRKTVEIEIVNNNFTYYINRKFINPIKFFKFLDYIKELKLNINNSYNISFEEVSEKEVKKTNDIFDCYFNALKIESNRVELGLPLRGSSDILILYYNSEKFTLGAAYRIKLERK